ncbi:AbrB/MazE/SpoVT family DNA-binding domain-containing protein [Virgibacillus sp. CBA3643]|uniref:AbrB/MazE/SpoVT family DNA-binding domain-containing protein n=1 Tax=Virgibacillus sp. CBA3643 TaxID=2942278 RepID=UPI0035A389EE
MESNEDKGVFRMTTKAQRWGNSIGVRIPFRVAKKYGLVNGSQIEMEEKESGIFFKPVEGKPTLDHLLSKCEGENPHEEFFSTPVGREEI